MLPTTAPPATAGTSTPKASKSSASAESATTAVKPSSASAATKHSRKEYPEQHAAQWREQNNQNDEGNKQNPAQRDSPPTRLSRGTKRSLRLRVRELNSRICGNYSCYPRRDQQEGLTIISAPHERDRLALK